MNKINIIIEQLKTLTLLETSELIKNIEITFGIDSSISLPLAPVTTNSNLSNTIVEKEEEKTAFEVNLIEVPADKKIAILKVVRTITGLGLKESKNIVDNIPQILKENATKEEAEKILKEIEIAGGKVIIK